MNQTCELAGFDKIFPLCTTVEEAAKKTIASFQVLHQNQWGAELLAI